MYTHYAWQTTRVEGLVTETDRASDFKSRTQVIVELEWGSGKVVMVHLHRSPIRECRAFCT